MTKATLEENWKIITDLIDYGEGQAAEPPEVPGLTVAGRTVLGMKGSRRHAKTWAGNIQDLLGDVRAYYAGEYPSRERAEQLGTETFDALRSFAKRLNDQADNVGFI